MFESPWHWAVVALVAFVLFFGWKNLPDMARSLGRSLRIFKTEIKGMGEDDKARDAAKTEPAALEGPQAPQASQAAPTPQAPQATPESAARPRPAPSPNGRAEAPAKAE